MHWKLLLFSDFPEINQATTNKHGNPSKIYLFNTGGFKKKSIHPMLCTSWTLGTHILGGGTYWWTDLMESSPITTWTWGNVSESKFTQAAETGRWKDLLSYEVPSLRCPSWCLCLTARLPQPVAQGGQDPVFVKLPTFQMLQGSHPAGACGPTDGHAWQCPSGPLPGASMLSCFSSCLLHGCQSMGVC